MADNLGIETPETPQGPVATKDIGGIHFQKVILSNPDGTDAAPATQATLAAVLAALGPLATDAGLAAILAKLSSDPATQTTLSAILTALGSPVPAGLTSVQIKATIQTTDTTLLTVGDAVGSVLTFTNVARVNGGSFRIVGATIASDKKSITPQFRLWLFNTTSGITVSSNNSAFQSKYADYDARVRVIDLPALTTPADATNSTESRSEVTLPPALGLCATGARNLYGYLELVSGAYTPTNPVNFSVSLLVEQN